MPADLLKHTTTTYTTIFTVLQHAISLSVVFTSGAGGYSLSPSVRNLRVVDDRTSPAFKLLREMSLGPMGVDITVPEVRESALEALFFLFKTGRASPLDTSAAGETLIERLPFFRHEEGIAHLLSMEDENLSGALDVLSRLSAWSVPADMKSNFKR
jgi:hypothetical protein